MPVSPTTHAHTIKNSKVEEKKTSRRKLAKQALSKTETKHDQCDRVQINTFAATHFKQIPAFQPKTPQLPPS